MFFDIGGFLLLSLFACFVAGGAMAGYRFVRVVALRGKLEARKVEQGIQSVEHQIAISEHQNSLQVMALTAGKPVKEEEEKPEEVKIDSTYTPLTGTFEERIQQYKEKAEAVDAQFEEVKTGPAPFIA